MAEQGALKPFHLISKDRHRWARAEQAKGLSFGGASAEAATTSVRSAVWLAKPLASPDAPTADFAVSEAGGAVLVEAGP
jgi:hypothetical protein